MSDPSEASKIDDEELMDLDLESEDDLSDRTPSDRRSRSSTGHRAGRGMGGGSHHSGRFCRTSAAPAPARDSGSRGSAINKLWKARGRTVDQTVNLHDKRVYSDRSMVDMFWESQKLGGSLTGIDYTDTHQVRDLGDNTSGRVKKCRYLLVFFAAILVLTVLLFAVPQFGMVSTTKTSTNDITDEPAPTEPPQEVVVPKEPETQPIEEEEDTPATEEEEEENLPVLHLEEVPQESRYKAFEFFVVDQDITEQVQLDIMGSPSKKALHWITQQDPAQMEIPGLEMVATSNLQAERAILQRYALVVFYYSMSAASSVALSRRGSARRQLQGPDKEVANREAFETSWLSIEPICQWHGVVCADDFESVLEVNLPQHLLQGTIPRELLVGAAMPYLVSVDLSRNQLQGDLADVTQERENAGVRLGMDPALSALQVLKLSGNRLTGKLDPLLGLPKLKQVDLKANRLAGTIPENLGRMTHLEKLHLEDNIIVGTVPTQLGELTKLQGLRLDGTKLTGAMPQEVCALRDAALTTLVTPCDGITCDCCSECFRL